MQHVAWLDCVKVFFAAAAVANRWLSLHGPREDRDRGRCGHSRSAGGSIAGLIASRVGLIGSTAGLDGQQ